MLIGDGYQGVFVAAVLASDLAVLALLAEVLAYVLAREGVATLVGAWADGVTTPGVSRQVGFHAVDLTGPLAAFLVMGAVDTKTVHPLLKMHIAEVVEASCLARGARVVLADAFLDA